MRDQSVNQGNIEPYEQARLSDLHRLGVLDTAEEPSFNDLLALAAQLCGASLGAITFVDEYRVFKKAVLGISTVDVPRRASICDYTIRQDEPLIIEDVLSDERFQSNELVRQSGIRFYAGVSLSISNALRLGAVCVLAPEPRTISVLQKENLTRIARQISHLLTLKVERQIAQRLARKSALQQQLFETYFDNTPVETCLKHIDGRVALYNRAFAARFKIGMDEWIGKTSFDLWPRAVAEEITADEAEIRVSGKSKTRYVTVPDGEAIAHWRSTRIPCRDTEGREMTLCISVDVTEEARRRLQLEQTKEHLEAARAQLQNELKKDDVTGLENRRSFEAKCLAQLFTLKTGGEAFAVIEIEVGALSLFNRRFGTHVVDKLLRDVAHAIQTDSSGNESAARIAGGSFRVLIMKTSQLAADRTSLRIQRAVEEITWPGGFLSPRVDLRFFSNRDMHPGDLFSAPAKAATKRSPYKVDVVGARRRSSMGLAGLGNI